MGMNGELGDSGLEDELLGGGVISLSFLGGDDDPTNNNMSETANWAEEAMTLIKKGELNKALHFLNLCLPENHLSSRRDLAQNLNDASIIPEAEEICLREKRCLVLMKLRLYDKAKDDAIKILEKKPTHGLGFKCLLAALCKMDKLEMDEVKKVLKLWKAISPKDLDVIVCRNKVEPLLDAVTSGIESTRAFSNIEDVLGLTYDNLIGMKTIDSQWKYRPPPSGRNNSFVLCLQNRFGHCSLSDKCTEAHGELELEEWKRRCALDDVSLSLENMKLDSKAAYIKSIMEERKIQEEDNGLKLFADSIPGVSLGCSTPLTAQVQSSKMETLTWEFMIESPRPLAYVCLLSEFHRPYFRIGSSFFNGISKVNLNSEKPSQSSLQVLDVSVSPSTVALTGSGRRLFQYSVEVIFTPAVFGTFHQTVVFDFKERPMLAKEVSVEVVPPPDEESQFEPNEEPTDRIYTRSTNVFGTKLKRRGTWNFGNSDIVDSDGGNRVSSNKVGFALMTSPTPTMIKNENPAEKELHCPLTKENYKERMRFFLTQEERARQVILSHYNMSAKLTLFDRYDMKGGYNEGTTRYAVDGALFGQMPLFRDVSEDTAVGRLILRSCNAVLLTQTDVVTNCEAEERKPRVYLCAIADKTKNSMYFEVGRACVRELGLEVDHVSSFDIQFQLDRTAFMEQKKVIDQITEDHLEMLFPNFHIQFNIPWSPAMQWNPSVENESFRLNPKQKEALIAITTKASRTPPILIIGPFGTGKTFTLFQCIKYILKETNTRIMICTHSNSAADLYIKEYLDPMVQAGTESARPLRIYYSLRNLNTVHSSILQYCVIENGRFRNPTRDEVLRARVVVVTLSTSYALIDLGLPSDAFSHILLDEAAQAMESEAITPLMAAGANTKLVLAGDHMQLSPELFSEDSKHFHASLLERLHCHYPDNHPCKLMLCENYRSHSAIIEFASDSFYQKKLESGMDQPAHPIFHPLTFFSARGEDVQESDSTSYFNMAEVFEVSDKVVQLISSWPESWGSWRDDNAIGVLTPYPDQVTRIRHRLRKKGLYNVSVERVLNVQGKQFRAVFLSTVRTFKPYVRLLPDTVGSEVDMGFFSNPKLLNTALTRAQSLVAVVGDPVSLCSLGKCRRLWEDFIHKCHLNKALYGMTYTQIKQNILGVEMRLTWGLNPFASEFEPQTVNPYSRTVAPKTQLQSQIPDSAGCVKGFGYDQLSSVPRNAPFPPVPFRNPFYPMPFGLGWRAPMPPFEPSNPYCFGPPPPMGPAQKPYYPGNPPGNGPPPPVLLRQPGYPYLSQPAPQSQDNAGPPFMALPFRRASSSAFAPYMPQPRGPPTHPQLLPPPPHPSSVFPPLGSAQAPQGFSGSENPAQHDPRINVHNPWNAPSNSKWPEFSGRSEGVSEQFAAGSPLYRFPSDDVWARPPQFQPQQQQAFTPQTPWLNQGPRMPYSTDIPPSMAAYAQQQKQQFLQAQSQAQVGPKPQNFTSEEMLRIKKVLEDYTASQNQKELYTGQPQEPLDETIQNIQSKLSMAVSGLSEVGQCPPSANQGLSGLAYNNNNLPAPRTNFMIPTNELPMRLGAGPHRPDLHTQSATLRHQAYVRALRETEASQLHGQKAQPQVTEDAGSVFRLRTQSVNPLSTPVVVNGYGAQKQVANPLSVATLSSGNLGVGTNSIQSLIPPLSAVSWARPDPSASANTNGLAQSTYPQHVFESKPINEPSSSFGRSYANAVKKPLSQQNSSSLDIVVGGSKAHVDGADVQNAPPQQVTVSAVKPLMGMTVTLPLSFSPRLRTRKEKKRGRKLN